MHPCYLDAVHSRLTADYKSPLNPRHHEGTSLIFTNELTECKGAEGPMLENIPLSYVRMSEILKHINCDPSEEMVSLYGYA